MHAFIEWDRALFHAINGGLSCKPLDVVMPLITDLGLGHVQVAYLLGGALALAWRRGELRGRPLPAAAWQALCARRRWLVPAVVAIILTGAAVQVPKRFHRQRPSWFYVNQQRAGRFLDVRVRTIDGRRPLRVNGFPSGHTATTTAIAFVLTRRLPRRRGYRAAVSAAWLMTAAIGLSRIYMADHWPLDVIGGMAFGLIGGAVTLALTRGRSGGGAAAVAAGAGSSPLPESRGRA